MSYYSTNQWEKDIYGHWTTAVGCPFRTPRWESEELRSWERWLNSWKNLWKIDWSQDIRVIGKSDVLKNDGRCCLSIWNQKQLSYFKEWGGILENRCSNAGGQSPVSGVPSHHLVWVFYAQAEMVNGGRRKPKK